MTAVVGVECDGCGTRLTKTTVSQASIIPVREEAKRRGWRKGRSTYQAISGHRYGCARDVCPECVANGVPINETTEES